MPLAGQRDAETDEEAPSRRLPGWRYEEIKQAASIILTCLGIDSFPIDPTVIARRSGMELRPYSMLPLECRLDALTVSPDGFNVRDPGSRRVICYNDAMPAGRMRFTLMHEIWHVLLNHTEHGRLAELEANFAAGYTLAPPPAIWACQPLFGPLGIEAMCGMSGRAAECAYSRYQSWLKHHSAGGRLEPYEESLVDSFSTRLLIERQQREMGGEDPAP